MNNKCTKVEAYYRSATGKTDVVYVKIFFGDGLYFTTKAAVVLKSTDITVRTRVLEKWEKNYSEKYVGKTFEYVNTKVDLIPPKSAYGKIRDELSQTALWLSLSEEAAELSAAAAKMARKVESTNPTPKSRKQCAHDVWEEYTDVQMISSILGLHQNRSIHNKKLCRWIYRLSTKEK